MNARSPHEVPWIQTASGNTFPLIRPQPEHVHINDVAEALAKICRFNGHTEVFFSVAQHSLLVEQLVREEGAGCCPQIPRRDLHLYALLHDAHEAYVGDLCTPLKWALERVCGFEGWRLIVSGIDQAVFSAFDLSYPMPSDVAEAVRRADQRALATERRDFLRDQIPWGIDLPDPAPWQVRAFAWPAAADHFLARFEQLTAQ